MVLLFILVKQQAKEETKHQAIVDLYHKPQTLIASSNDFLFVIRCVKLCGVLASVCWACFLA